MMYFKFVRTEKNAPMTHMAFLLEVTNSEQFMNGKRGVDGIELAIKTREAIRNQQVEAHKRGYWEFEDEQAKHIKHGVENIQWNGAKAEMLYPFAKASTTHTEKPPEDVTPAEAPADSDSPKPN